jgi:hypothetical protein
MLPQAKSDISAGASANDRQIKPSPVNTSLPHDLELWRGPVWLLQGHPGVSVWLLLCTLHPGEDECQNSRSRMHDLLLLQPDLAMVPPKGSWEGDWLCERLHRLSHRHATLPLLHLPERARGGREAIRVRLKKLTHQILQSGINRFFGLC